MNFRLLLFTLLLGHIACNAQQEDASSTKSKTEVTQAPVPDSYDCKLHGLQLKEEMHWMADKQMLFAIAAQGADISGSAPKYRRFLVYTTHDCNMINYTLMPDNRDNKPYLLFPETYEPINELVCAQGYDYAFCYHVRRKEFLLPMMPRYTNPRSKSPESGAPEGMAIWGNYLFAAASQHGTFAYDMSERSNPKALLPKVEYIDRDNRTYKQLFIVSTTEAQQAFIPKSENGQLILKPLLNDGEELISSILQDRQTGRYAIARTKADDRPLVFDLQTGKRLDLPNRLKESRDVLAYLQQLK